MPHCLNGLKGNILEIALFKGPLKYRFYLCFSLFTLIRAFSMLSQRFLIINGTIRDMPIEMTVKAAPLLLLRLSINLLVTNCAIFYCVDVQIRLSTIRALQRAYRSLTARPLSRPSIKSAPGVQNNPLKRQVQEAIARWPPERRCFSEIITGVKITVLQTTKRIGDECKYLNMDEARNTVSGHKTHWKQAVSFSGNDSEVIHQWIAAWESWTNERSP